MRAEITEQAKAKIEQPPEPMPPGIAGLMVELRKMAGLNQGEVAEIIGLGRTSVTNIEKGNQPATIEHLEKLAASLDLEVVVTVREKGKECNSCNGMGSLQFCGGVDCPDCNGTGEAPNEQRSGESEGGTP